MSRSRGRLSCEMSRHLVMTFLTFLHDRYVHNLWKIARIGSRHHPLINFKLDILNYDIFISRIKVVQAKRISAPACREREPVVTAMFLH